MGKNATEAKIDHLRSENEALKRQISELLRHIEIRDLALNATGIMVRITDLNGVVQFINQTHTNLLGYTEEDRIGHATFEVVHPDDRQRVTNFFHWFVKQPDMEESPPIEYRMRHKDGHYLWARAMGRIVRKKDTPSLVVITVWDITKSREMEYQLHALAERLHTVREEERTNISREIHDVFGQALTSLKFELAILARSFLPDQQNAHAKARSILQSIDEIIQLIRKISTELRPPILDDFGLKAAIEWQTADFQKKTGIKCTLNSDLENELSIDKKKAISLFRIFQEALTNVARHAGATQVVINFYYKKKKLIMQVKDNGRGISKAEMEGKTSLGLMGMRERVFSLNGDLKIEGKPEEGTVITVEVPM